MGRGEDQHLTKRPDRNPADYDPISYEKTTVNLLPFPVPKNDDVPYFN
jgi:hypothetical protein